MSEEINADNVAAVCSKPTGEKITEPEPEKSKKKKRNNGREKKYKYLKKSEYAGEKQIPAKPPNYFFAVEITEPKIKGVMHAVQDCIVGQEKLLQSAVVDVDMAHITLGLLHLPDEETVNKASQRLEDCKEDLEKIFQSSNFSLNVDRIGHFRSNVVYAKISEDENEEKLRQIANFLEEKFADLRSTNSFDYKPHVTLLKLSKIRNTRIKKKIRRIDTNLFRPFQHVHFGTQPIETLQLLSMFKQSDGYYHCECEIPLGNFQADQYEEDDEKQYAEYVASYSIASGLCEALLKKAKECSKGNILEPPEKMKSSSSVDNGNAKEELSNCFREEVPKHVGDDIEPVLDEKECLDSMKNEAQSVCMKERNEKMHSINDDKLCLDADVDKDHGMVKSADFQKEISSQISNFGDADSHSCDKEAECTPKGESVEEAKLPSNL